MAPTVGLNLFGSGFPTTDQRWMLFAEAIESCGYDIVDGLERAGDFYISVDFNSMPKWAKDLNSPRRALIAIEPPVVNPRQYTARVWKAFGIRIALSPDHANRINGHWHPSPSYLETIPSQKPSEPDCHAIGLINANKNSLIYGNLYGLRREVIREMARQQINFVLAGPDWEGNFGFRALRDARKLVAAFRARAPIDFSSIDLKSIPTTTLHHLGPVQRKHDFFRMVETVLVIENSSTYVSEKLAEVVSHNRLPIYVGPSLDNFGIPPSIVAHADPSVDAVMETFTMLSENQKTEIIEDGQYWLKSQDSIYSQSQSDGMRSLAQFVTKHFVL